MIKINIEPHVNVLCERIQHSNSTLPSKGTYIHYRLLEVSIYLG